MWNLIGKQFWLYFNTKFIKWLTTLFHSEYKFIMELFLVSIFPLYFFHHLSCFQPKFILKTSSFSCHTRQPNEILRSWTVFHAERASQRNVNSHLCMTQVDIDTKQKNFSLSLPILIKILSWEEFYPFFKNNMSLFHSNATWLLPMRSIQSCRECFQFSYKREDVLLFKYLPTSK